MHPPLRGGVHQELHVPGAVPAVLRPVSPDEDLGPEKFELSSEQTDNTLKNCTNMENLPIFALSSNSNERSRFERLSSPVGFFYAPVRPICGSVTPCRSRNARQLVGSLTAGSAEPLFVFSTQPVIVIKLCQTPTTIAGRSCAASLPARPGQGTPWRSCAPSMKEPYPLSPRKKRIFVTASEKFPIFAVSSYCNKRTDVRLLQQIGIFYALSLPICGPVTPCRSRNARRLVASWTTGSAGPFFISARQPVILFKLCPTQQRMAGRSCAVLFRRCRT